MKQYCTWRLILHIENYGKCILAYAKALLAMFYSSVCTKHKYIIAENAQVTSKQLCEHIKYFYLKQHCCSATIRWICVNLPLCLYFIKGKPNSLFYIAWTWPFVCMFSWAKLNKFKYPQREMIINCANKNRCLNHYSHT